MTALSFVIIAEAFRDISIKLGYIAVRSTIAKAETYTSDQ